MGLSDLFIDVSNLPKNGYGFFQLLCIGIVYMNLLMFGSNMISDGSELLLLIPSIAGLVGSVILPILGAVPDGAIVLFSGLGPDAQEQLDVGIGALAGSTIMLLTIPWFLSIVGGRVNIVNGKPSYKSPKLNPSGRFDLYETGIKLSDSSYIGGLFMFATTISYFVIQIPGLVYINESDSKKSSDEGPYALAGLIICFFLLGCYLYYQFIESFKVTNELSKLRDDCYIAAIQSGKITLLGLMTEVFQETMKQANEISAGESTTLISNDVPS